MASYDKVWVLKEISKRDTDFSFINKTKQVIGSHRGEKQQSLHSSRSNSSRSYIADNNHWINWQMFD